MINGANLSEAPRRNKYALAGGILGVIVTLGLKIEEPLAWLLLSASYLLIVAGLFLALPPESEH